MTFREAVGMAAIVSGTVLLPIGWMFSRMIWVVALLLFGIGGAMFYTDRNIKKDIEIDKESTYSGNYGSAMPNDIHNYTGWQDGGRGDSSGFDTHPGADDA